MYPKKQFLCHFKTLFMDILFTDIKKHTIE